MKIRVWPSRQWLPLGIMCKGTHWGIGRKTNGMRRKRFRLYSSVCLRLLLDFLTLSFSSNYPNGGPITLIYILTDHPLSISRTLLREACDELKNLGKFHSLDTMSSFPSFHLKLPSVQNVRNPYKNSINHIYLITTLLQIITNCT